MSYGSDLLKRVIADLEGMTPQEFMEIHDSVSDECGNLNQINGVAGLFNEYGISDTLVVSEDKFEFDFRLSSSPDILIVFDESPEADLSEDQYCRAA